MAIRSPKITDNRISLKDMKAITRTAASLDQAIIQPCEGYIVKRQTNGSQTFVPNNGAGTGGGRKYLPFDMRNPVRIDSTNYNFDIYLPDLTFDEYSAEPYKNIIISNEASGFDVSVTQIDTTDWYTTTITDSSAGTTSLIKDIYLNVDRSFAAQNTYSSYFTIGDGVINQDKFYHKVLIATMYITEETSETDEILTIRQNAHGCQTLFVEYKPLDIQLSGGAVLIYLPEFDPYTNTSPVKYNNEAVTPNLIGMVGGNLIDNGGGWYYINASEVTADTKVWLYLDTIAADISVSDILNPTVCKFCVVIDEETPTIAQLDRWRNCICIADINLAGTQNGASVFNVVQNYNGILDLTCKTGDAQTQIANYNPTYKYPTYSIQERNNNGALQLFDFDTPNSPSSTSDLRFLVHSYEGAVGEWSIPTLRYLNIEDFSGMVEGIIEIPLHNDLEGLDGGTCHIVEDSGDIWRCEYYHLTKEEYDALQNGLGGGTAICHQKLDHLQGGNEDPCTIDPIYGEHDGQRFHLNEAQWFGISEQFVSPLPDSDTAFDPDYEYIDHNSNYGLQGGTIIDDTYEFYHLSKDQYDHVLSGGTIHNDLSGLQGGLIYGDYTEFYHLQLPEMQALQFAITEIHAPSGVFRVDHSNLWNLSGGDPAVYEYYHLTEQAYTDLNGWSDLGKPHNSLGDLQGGAVDEYYHVTSAQAALFTTDGIDGGELIPPN